jgi:WD40 repeat protein
VKGESSIHTVCLSSDDKMLLSGADDGVLTLWQLGLSYPRRPSRQTRYRR